jgi:hypothetical protein
MSKKLICLISFILVLGSGAGQTWGAYRAAYWDSNFARNWIDESITIEMRDYFAAAGYEILDADQLKVWMDARIADGSISVVVFCKDIAPETVCETNTADCTLRKYLDAGGKIVCHSDIPFWNQGHRGGDTTLWKDSGATGILGFTAVGPGSIRNSYNIVQITEAGFEWGLTETWESRRPVDASVAAEENLTVLATDDAGHAAAWVKHYVPDDTTQGFVRVLDTNTTLRPNFDDLKRLAEYGLITELARKPSPKNGATIDLSDATRLSWTAGEYAVKHDVYFGAAFDDVNDGDVNNTTGIYRGRQSLPIYTPKEALELGKTYYWRIDEVNAPPDSDIHNGNVWSFTISEFLTVDDFEGYNAGENEMWWAWKDGLGYVAHDNEPAYPGNGTGAAVGDETTNSFTEESIVHGGRQSMPYWYNNNKQGFLTYSEATHTLTDTRDWTEQGVKALSLWFRGFPPLLGGFVEAPAGTFTMSAEGADIWGSSDEFRFAWQELTGEGEIIAKVESVENTNPWAKAGIMIRDTLDPDSAFTMVAITPGNGVWFGRRTGGNTASDSQAGITAPQWIKLDRSIGGLARASYSSDGINWTPLGTSEAVVMNNPMYIGLALTSHEPGVACEAVFSNVISNGTGPWVSQDIGLTSNEAEPMYLSISNNNGTTGTVYYDDNQNIDPNVTLIDTWTEWNIDLKDFMDQGVDLSDVNSITIGIGDKDDPQHGGSGKMFLDDIRLYQPRYVPGKATPLRADFTGDGIVDDDDLEIMLNDWLLGDYTIYATPPGPAMSQWEFENNVNDSIGGLNGTTRGNPTYAAGQSGQALNLDGDDYVDLGNPAELDFGTVDWSICAWVKTSMTGTGDENKGVIYAKGGDRDGGIRYSLNVNENQAVQGSIDLVTDDNVNKREAISSVSVSDGQWHHIVGQRVGDTINVYIDGILDGTANLPADYDLSGTSQHNAYIGVVTDNSTGAPEKYLVGSVDDVRIYNYALSQSEILDIMGVDELYFPLTSPANIYDEEPVNSKQVNDKDRAILDEEWLQESVWPEW